VRGGRLSIATITWARTDREERLLRDAHGAQFHPLPAKSQHRFTGRLALGLDPITDAA